MRGEFIGVWAETWHEIWFPLMDEPLSDNEEGVPFDLFCELYRDLAKALKAQPSIEALADIIDDPVQSREAFEKTTVADLAGERAVVTFLEAAHPALDDPSRRRALEPLLQSAHSLHRQVRPSATTCDDPAPCVRRSQACSRA